ncbi:DUF3429 domain-containing protein [Neiella sp. HB171785]|uniref:DUF3429 domain-containing protein n=1 Tax=Neiella litorisoli TaxID=2771431 RepID=A0A8J6QPR7_9GAMM|nr:DUF3429 domain-containing protein [Neiella litorisoli]MBD1388836.1 DUF3429 domain-containing protein [Neiella litorisoli]
MTRHYQSKAERQQQHQAEHRHISERLAYAGAIPFIALAGLLYLPADMLPGNQEQWVSALMTYSLIVVNFLAGSLWGRAIDNMERNHRGNGQLFAVLISLLSWMTIMLPPQLGFVLLACLLVSLRLHEMYGLSSDSAVKWYSKARSRLTVVASVVLCLAAAS